MTTIPPSEQERRTFQRIRLKLPLRFRTEEQTAWRTAATQDISAAGLLMVVEDCLNVSTRVILLLSVPREKAPRQLAGIVTRSEFDEGHHCYLIGIKFADLDEMDRKVIDATLRNTDIVGLLRLAAEAGASDVHLSTNQPPVVRIAGALKLLRKEPLQGPELKHMVYTLMDERQRQAFERDLELNFSLAVEPTVRYRVNVHCQRGNVEATCRRIEPTVHTFEELRLPTTLARFAELHDGLVLVTGPTGAGKTTTVAAMINHVNSTKTAVVITLENPIEYLYTYKKSVIKQREVGIDTRSYPIALREAMRQDPDIIVVGEVRDEETMKTALDAAETGHLVLATFPAANAIDTILRVIHFFDKDRQQEAQLQLANCLRAIVSLRLVPMLKGGVIPATEILVNTFGIANSIRTGALEQLPSMLQTGAQHGMHSMQHSLERLLREGRISPEMVKLHGMDLAPMT